jgi:hypothetical protein
MVKLSYNGKFYGKKSQNIKNHIGEGLIYNAVHKIDVY